jgi:hypothetical protein
LPDVPHAGQFHSALTTTHQQSHTQVFTLIIGNDDGATIHPNPNPRHSCHIAVRGVCVGRVAFW